ncbi:MAG TPA: GDSL-type esterase/lipase family protein [Gemmataceae bacterium]|nr:GDSL-type esterase/lipase family protein [Gemmataceae bacterium]
MRCRRALSLLAVAALTGAVAAQSKNSATTPAQRPEKGPAARHEQFLKRAAMGNVDVLFLGDSITQGWETSGKDVWARYFEKQNSANFGIGGDRTQHVLWRITDGKELEGISPKAAVLMIGTNNAGTNSAEEIAAGVEAIVKELRRQKPNMKILLLAVFPRSGKSPKDVADTKRIPAGDLNKKLPDVNQRIAKLDDGKSVKYLDIGSKFLDPEGGLSREVMPDYLHLSKKGYEIWADAIKGPLGELLK